MNVNAPTTPGSASPAPASPTVAIGLTLGIAATLSGIIFSAVLLIRGFQNVDKVFFALPILAGLIGGLMAYSVVEFFRGWRDALADLDAPRDQRLRPTLALAAWILVTTGLALSNAGLPWLVSIPLLALVVSAAWIAGQRGGVLRSATFGIGVGLAVCVQEDWISSPSGFMLAVGLGAMSGAVLDLIFGMFASRASLSDWAAFRVDRDKLIATSLGCVLAPFYFATGGELGVSEFGIVGLSATDRLGTVLSVFAFSLFFGALIGFVSADAFEGFGKLVGNVLLAARPQQGWRWLSVPSFGAAFGAMTGVLAAVSESKTSFADLAGHLAAGAFAGIFFGFILGSLIRGVKRSPLSLLTGAAIGVALVVVFGLYGSIDNLGEPSVFIGTSIFLGIFGAFLAALMTTPNATELPEPSPPSPEVALAVQDPDATAAARMHRIGKLFTAGLAIFVLYTMAKESAQFPLLANFEPDPRNPDHIAAVIKCRKVLNSKSAKAICRNKSLMQELTFKLNDLSLETPLLIGMFEGWTWTPAEELELIADGRQRLFVCPPTVFSRRSK